MKYRANPVVVSAYRILEVGERLASAKMCADALTGQKALLPAGSRWLRLDEGKALWATPEQLARINPVVGDYVVVQEDGYTYLNPREVFERKYSPLPGVVN